MNPRHMKCDPATMTGPVSIGTAPDAPPMPTPNCLGKFIDATGMNLTRANEILDTIISRIEGSGHCGEENRDPKSNCLMNCASDCCQSSAQLTERLDYLAKLITGSC